MTALDIFETVARLRAEGRTFCLATVVRTADITSAKAGARAAVLADGTLLGHLGGACVGAAVRRASAEALATGAVRLIRIKPADSVVALSDADGAQVFGSACPSGGTVDVLVEPHAPPPRVAIWGRTPIARALAGHLAVLGWRVAARPGVAAAGADAADLTEVLAQPHGLGPRDFAVIACQGEGDITALRSALASGAGRVSMIASTRKAAALRKRLADDGIPAERLATLKAPAGLDLGAIDPPEIALSVGAELMAWNASARLAAACGSGARAPSAVSGGI